LFFWRFICGALYVFWILILWWLAGRFSSIHASNCVLWCSLSDRSWVAAYHITSSKLGQFVSATVYAQIAKCILVFSPYFPVINPPITEMDCWQRNWPTMIKVHLWQLTFSFTIWEMLFQCPVVCNCPWQVDNHC
jgi:hypothetical protein